MAVLSNLLEAIASGWEERQAKQHQFYQSLGRMAVAQSSFDKVQADYPV